MFAGDPNIGGRYSALSAFGIVPAALMGIDVRALLKGADGAWRTAIGGDGAELAGAAASGAAGGPTQALPAGVWLGAALSALAGEGRDKLTFLISDSLPGLGLWQEQLVAESTGKHSTGILPVAEEPLGDESAYGEDRVFAYLTDIAQPDPALEDRVRALADAGHPLITIPTHGPADLGRVFLLSELAVAVAGWGLQINPFDQPNVQQAKDATKRVLADYEIRHELAEAPDADNAALRRLLSDASPPAYVAIMGYVQPSADFDAAVAELRVAIRARQRRRQGDDHVRLRSALPAFDRAVPQGRPEDRALPAAAARRPAGPSHPRRPVYLHDAQERRGDRRPEHLARARAARRARAPAGR